MKARVIVSTNADSSQPLACSDEVREIVRTVERAHGIGSVRTVDLHAVAVELVSVIGDALARGNALTAQEEAFDLLANLLGGEP